jgi:hypothetical protein
MADRNGGHPIKKVGSFFHVINIHTGKTLGKHATREQAEAQLRAIESHIHQGN